MRIDQARVITSYCKSIREMLDEPKYTLTALKIKRIKQQLEHITRIAQLEDNQPIW